MKKRKEMVELNKIQDILPKGTPQIITRKFLAENGFRSEGIRALVEAGKLIKIRHGLYQTSESVIDEYHEFQQRYSKGIYSYATALYFHGLSNRIPNIISYTLPNDYNASRIRTNLNIKYHFVKREYINVGVMELVSPQGDLIKVYDVERTICDIIKKKHKIDAQIYSDAIRLYFGGSNLNVRKIMKYAKIFKIEGEILRYMEILA